MRFRHITFNSFVMSSLTVALLGLGSLVSMAMASININTLPPDLRRLEFLDSVPPRSTINPVWSGEYSAALDGEQNKVLVSWTVLGPEEGVEFQVGVNICHTNMDTHPRDAVYAKRCLFKLNSFTK